MRTLLGFSPATLKQPSLPLFSYLLQNSRGLVVEILNYGATVFDVSMPAGDLARQSLTLHYDNYSDYFYPNNVYYLGSTLGRYARCISNGTFYLDNKKINVTANYPPHHFHGGALGFDTYVWEERTTSSSCSFSSVSLQLFSPHLDEGYPGDLHVIATFSIDNDNTFSIDYKAYSNRPTICDLTPHIFWSFDKSPSSIDTCSLCISADHFLNIDKHLLPLPSLSDYVHAPCFDFRHSKIVEALSIDNTFELNKGSNCCVLSSTDNNCAISLTTNQPALQVYTADNLPCPRSGICLQPGSFPNSPVYKHFPSPILRPGEIYNHVTKYKIHARSD
jgi:aldose 1-epimerase